MLKGKLKYAYMCVSMYVNKNDLSRKQTIQSARKCSMYICMQQ